MKPVLYKQISKQLLPNFNKTSRFPRMFKTEAKGLLGLKHANTFTTPDTISFNKKT
jgi:fructosamine-3-kinase